MAAQFISGPGGALTPRGLAPKVLGPRYAARRRPERDLRRHRRAAEGLLRQGPDRAKTYYQDDLVGCLLRGGFTRVEETLHEGGRGGDVIQQRMAFQELMRDRFKAVVERATGRRVIGLMSGNQQDHDMLCEVFVLAPTDLLDDDEPDATASERR